MDEKSDPEKSTTMDTKLPRLVELYFGLTISDEPDTFRTGETKALIYVPDVSESYGTQTLTLEILEQALFERVLMMKPEKFLKLNGAHTLNPGSNYHVLRTGLAFLFYSYANIKSAETKRTEENFEEIFINLIIRNTATVLRMPDLLESKILSSRIYDLFVENMSNEEILIQFFTDVCAKLKGEYENDAALAAFTGFFDLLSNRFATCTILNFPAFIFTIMDILTKIKDLAVMVVKYSIPDVNDKGAVYSRKLLGSMFNISCLCARTNSPPFFTSGISEEAVQKDLWTAHEHLTIKLNKIMLTLLRSGAECKDLLLEWIGGCLERNQDRKKIWSNVNNQSDANLDRSACVGNGFIMNLCAVLIELSVPLTDIANGKIFKVDPAYCAVRSEEESRTLGAHLRSLHKETAILPLGEGEEWVKTPADLDKFSFLTECFFMTHKALDIGMRTCVEQMTSLNQDISRIEDILANVGEDITNVDRGLALQIRALKDGKQTIMERYLCLLTVMTVPNTRKKSRDFHVATSSWLIQVFLDDQPMEGRKTFAPLSEKDVKFHDVNPSPLMKCVPEFLLENVHDFMQVTHRFAPDTWNTPVTRLRPLLSTIVLFMGRWGKLRNPHIRARLAECLNAVVPHDMHPPSLALVTKAAELESKTFFIGYRYHYQMVKALLEVFVDIEATGQSVAFEQKFSYRRPMYNTMDYMLSVNMFQYNFTRLAELALQNMEAVNPPLFLRFVNTLINDAIFLLDDALTHMSELRTLMQAGPPASMDERQNVEHIGAQARFDNVMGLLTIQTLIKLTSFPCLPNGDHVKNIFCHPLIVDRIAAMLNYFLSCLVGPKSKNLKVSSMEKYKFHPQVIVKGICQIYINLGENEKFCSAVSADGRSYSPELFRKATDVLFRIRGHVMVNALREVEVRVAQNASKNVDEDELLAEAPEEFVDPIMSTLMRDPVTLPSSKAIVDRSTIARHILSDQTDPFNRAPLTMEMVIPNVELKTKISEWIQEKKNKRDDDDDDDD